MLKLRDIMTTEIAFATRDMSLREAMEILTIQHISGLPVMEGDKVVGVFSSTDVLACLEQLDDACPPVSFRTETTPLEEVTVADVMTRDVKSLGPDCPVDLAASFMRRCQIHRVLVMAQGNLVGIVTTTDLAATIADRRVGKQDYGLVCELAI